MYVFFIMTVTIVPALLRFVHYDLDWRQGEEPQLSFMKNHLHWFQMVHIRCLLEGNKQSIFYRWIICCHAKSTVDPTPLPYWISFLSELRVHLQKSSLMMISYPFNRDLLVKKINNREVNNAKHCDLVMLYFARCVWLNGERITRKPETQLSYKASFVH